MITRFLLDLVYGFAYGLSLVVSSFGDVPENNLITTAISAMSSYYSALNDYLPLNTLIQIAFFLIVYHGAVFLYKLIRWGYQKVPGIT